MKDKIGLGHWSRNQHEPLLIGSRGTIPAPTPGDQLPSVLFAPRGEHSVKPEAVAEMIERLYLTTPKLEMFYRALDDPAAEQIRRAKREAAGWFFHGNEAG